MENTEIVIQQTKNWIESIVIGHQFCPYAQNPFKNDSIAYQVFHNNTTLQVLENLIRECMRMESDTNIETALLIFPEQFSDFEAYLDLLDLCESIMSKEGYDGVFQVASFHPQYVFSGSDDKDPANYTNRSPHPMLHILREDSLTAVLKNNKHALEIPEKNIERATALGLEYFKTAMKKITNKS